MALLPKLLHHRFTLADIHIEIRCMQSVRLRLRNSEAVRSSLVHGKDSTVRNSGDDCGERANFEKMLESGFAVAKEFRRGPAGFAGSFELCVEDACCGD